MPGKGLFLKMHIVLGRNLGKIPGYETKAGLVNYGSEMRGSWNQPPSLLSDGLNASM